ncbi:MAG TPA: YdeI/OmpD-associated family protein [Terracidiphilus sp.]|nr:YdeI/OmpD-associated family protein [Terracidiphilus sp.]
MKQYKFEATIQSVQGAAGRGGACVFFPYDVEKEFGTRGQVPVKITYDGVPYTGTMVKYGHPQHMLPLLKDIREKLGKGPGDAVKVVVERDTSPRTVEVPPELEKLLKKEKLMPVFEALSYTHRKEYVRWITEARKEETRQARLAKTVTMLRGGVKTPG